MNVCPVIGKRPSTAYNNYGCRCPVCRRGHAAYQRHWRRGQRRRCDATRTHALVKWMMEQGATQAWIAGHANITPQYVSLLQHARYPSVRVDIARAVARVAVGCADGTRRPPVWRPVMWHGTDAGYQRHVRAGEDPCGDCRAGHAREAADRRAHREAA